MHRSFGSSNKTFRPCLSSESQPKDLGSTAKGSSVDLSKLEMAALWRYLLHFNLVSAFRKMSYKIESKFMTSLVY